MEFDLPPLELDINDIDIILEMLMEVEELKSLGQDSSISNKAIILLGKRRCRCCNNVVIILRKNNK